MAFLPLDREKHAHLTFSPVEDYRFATTNVVTLLPFEVVEAARCFPVAFPGNGAIPHALLGLGQENIFVTAEGQWTAPYLPLQIRNYPFALAATTSAKEAEQPQLVLAIDPEAPHFAGNNGKLLYSKKGKPTAELTRITQAIAAQNQRFLQSQPALQELALSGVLVERTVTLEFEGQTRSIGGVRLADQEKVMGLSAEVLARWVKNGIMEMLYAHWWSMRHLQTLLEHPSCPSPVQ